MNERIFLDFLVEHKKVSIHQAEELFLKVQKEKVPILELLSYSFDKEILQDLMEDFSKIQHSATIAVDDNSLGEEETNILLKLEELSQKPSIEATLSTSLKTKIRDKTNRASNIYFDSLSPAAKKSDTEEKADSTLASAFHYDSRYKVLETLGEGGMGIVELAQDTHLKREVALKHIKLGNKGVLTKKQKIMLWRLKKEAEITAILEHPNIVPLHDMQQLPSGGISLTMRKIEGVTLNALLKKIRQGDLEQNEHRLLSIFLKICDAVSYAHSKGVVHRDLKPDNIMVGQFGEVYVMDWGIAKLTPKSEEEPDETYPFMDNASPPPFETVGGVGTHGYMPPEQAEDATQVRPAADIYALGKILKQTYLFISPLQELQELISSQSKIRSSTKKTTRKIALKHAQKIPSDIRAIVAKATDEDWEKRYSKVQDLSSDIELYLKNRQVSARTYNLLESFLKWGRRNWKGLSVVGLIVLICFVFWGYLLQVKKEAEKEQKNLAKQQKERAYKKAMKLAKEEEEKVKHLPAKAIGKKIKHSLKALNYLTTALSLKLEEPLIEKKKFELSEKLIRLACESQDYKLAHYLAGELQSLKSIRSKKRQTLAAWVEKEEHKTYRLDEKRLNFWIEELNKNILSSEMREDAIFEISRMQEDKIFQRMIEILEEGTHYFLTEKNRSTRKDEYYQTMLHALGQLENPKSEQPLLHNLKKMVAKICSLEPQPKTEIEYMVEIMNALRRLKINGMAEGLFELRQKMKFGSLFWKKTERIYKDMLLIKPLTEEKIKTVQAFHKRGILSYLRGDFAAALADFNKGISLNSEFSDLYLSRGYTKSNLEDFLGAIEDFNKAIELKPEEYAAYFNRGVAKTKFGQLEDALQDFNIVIKKAPNFSECFYNRGNVFFLQKKLDLALNDFNTVIEMEPLHLQALNNRGQTFFELKEFKKAIEDYSEAIKIDSKNSSLFYNRGQAKEEIKNYEGALEDYSIAIRLNPQKTSSYLRRGNLKSKLKDFSGALADLNQAILLEPNNPKHYSNRGGLYISMNDFNKALESFSKAIVLAPKFYQFYYNRGVLYFNLGHLNKAEEDFSQIISLVPRFAYGHYFLGRIYQAGGDHEKAIEYFNQAKDIDPFTKEFYFDSGKLKVELGKYKEAIEDFSRIIELSPKSVEAFYNRGMAKLYNLDYPGAIKDYSKAIELAPQNYKPFYQRGNAYLFLKKMENAKEDFLQFLVLTEGSKNPKVLAGKMNIIDTFPELLAKTKLDTTEKIKILFDVGVRKYKSGEKEKCKIFFQEYLKLTQHSTDKKIKNIRKQILKNFPDLKE